MLWDEVEVCVFESFYRSKDNAAVKEQIMSCASLWKQFYLFIFPKSGVNFQGEERPRDWSGLQHVGGADAKGLEKPGRVSVVWES